MSVEKEEREREGEARFVVNVLNPTSDRAKT